MENLNIKEKEIEKVKALLKTISYNDSRNHEGIVAKIFFRSLYGSGFIRHSDTGINRALNYGYKIVLSAITRSIAKYGLNNHLGVFHSGQTNPFNLAYDFIEPVRPLIDNFISSYGEEIYENLNYNLRLELIEVLQNKVKFNREMHVLNHAIDQMVRSYLSALKYGDSSKLLIPFILKDKNKTENHDL